MEIKYCQMLVAKDYNEALEKCNIQEKVDIPDEELTIANDVSRSTLISLNKSFDDFRKIWLEDYQQTADNKYDQANIEGSNIPVLKMKAIKNAIVLNLYININIGQFGFSYFDDKDNLCGFTLTLLPDCPSLWFAAVTVHTNAPDNQRQVTVFTPQFSRSLLDNTEQFNNMRPDLESTIANNMNLDTSLLIPMNSLNEYLGYALNSQFVKYFISPLFDKQGVVQLEKFNSLLEAIKHEKSMFEFSEDKEKQEAIIQKALHQCELSQLLVHVTKAKALTENARDFDPLIEYIQETMADYKLNKYNAIKQNQIVVALGKNYEASKFREFEEALHGDDLFLEDNYELQNARLRLLLGSYADSPFKAAIKEYQQIVAEEFLDINKTVGLTKESLAKDLAIVGDLLLKPSVENFEKFESRIKTSDKAAKKREIAGHIMTSGAALLAGGLAATVTLTSAPIAALALTAFGIFGTGGTAAVGYDSANRRNKYKSELQGLGNTLIAGDPKAWVLSQLKTFLIQNKKATNELTIKRILDLNEKIAKASNLKQSCNALAQAILLLNESDITTANTLLEIRKQVLGTQPAPYNSNFSRQILVDNLAWINDKKDWINKQTEDFVKKFNNGLLEPLTKLAERKSKDEKRDEILGNFLYNIRQESDKDSLIFLLDNAIFELLANSKNSKIGADLLVLRKSLVPLEEEKSLGYGHTM